MVRVFISLFCCLFPFSVVAKTTSDIDQFLASRHVVTQVFFAKQTAELSQAAKRQIDAIVSDLRNYAKQKMLIRVEGFASPEGENQDNLKLSLQRALTVESYLFTRHNLNVSVFLTGFGEMKKTAGKLAIMRRVDIAVYKKNSATEVLFDKSGEVERFILQ